MSINKYSRIIQFVSHDMEVDKTEPYIYLSLFNDAISSNPRTFADGKTPSFNEEIEVPRKRYDRYIVYLNNVPYYFFINSEDINFAVPILEGIIREKTRESQQKATELKAINDILVEQKRRLELELKKYKRPFYKKIVDYFKLKHWE